MAKLDWYIRANLKLRHLQLLVALDDLRSAGRVAAYLNVTQPAVSKMLAAIEDGVGLALFERTFRGIRPTECGACLVRHAREILDCLGNAHAELQDIGQGKLTRVSLGILPSLAAELIPRLVSTLEATTESVAISVREGTMETLLPGLRSGELDLVVGFLPAKPMGSEYVREHLYEDPTVTVVRAGHPLSGRASLGWDDLSEYPMILPPKGSLVRAAIDSFMLEHRVRVPRRHLESISTLTNLGVLQKTDSIGFFQRRLARHFSAQGSLDVLPLGLPDLSMGVGLIWMADRRLTEGVRLVKRLLHEFSNSEQLEQPSSRSFTRVTTAPPTGAGRAGRSMRDPVAVAAPTGARRRARD
jgi:DNA-binding transcriptional LysR family regulator